MKNFSVDPRPRNPQGQFVANATGGADPASMAAAYGGVAEAKQGRLSIIERAMLRVRRNRNNRVVIEGSNVPSGVGSELSSRSKVVHFRRNYEVIDPQSLTGKVAKDRLVKKIQDEDQDRRDANMARAGVAGAAAGAILPFPGRRKIRILPRAAIGGLLGAASVLAVRKATESTKDLYGERSRGAKRAENLAPMAGVAATGYGLYRIAKRRFKFSDSRVVILFQKKPEKKGMNPYVGAAISGGVSGAVLGMVPILRRGTKLVNAAKSAAGMGAASAGIVGGGAYIGSKIIGDPEKGEGAAFTKRAALGGGIAGAATGAAGAIVLKKIPGARRALRSASKEWRPALWIRKAGVPGAVGIGAASGGIYGAAQGADEGQQVDSILNLRKDMKRGKKTHLAASILGIVRLKRLQSPAINL